MGLDMYLDGVFSKKAYYQEDRTVPMEDPIESDSLKLALASIDFPNNVPLDFSYRHFEVKLPLATWRKSNQIHNYIVKKIG